MNADLFVGPFCQMYVTDSSSIISTSLVLQEVQLSDAWNKEALMWILLVIVAEMD